MRLEWNKSRLRLQGANVASTAACSPITLHGKRLTIGEFCSVGRAYIQALDEVRVGNNVVINDGVKLITGSHDVNSETYQQITSPIVIEDYSWVAMNATILGGVVIGTGAVVAAGSVVTQNVAPYQIVAGNPARPIKERTCRTYRYKPSYWFGPVAAWVGTQQKESPQTQSPSVGLDSPRIPSNLTTEAW